MSNMSRAYMNRTSLAEDFNPNPKAFNFLSYSVVDPVAPYDYTPKRGVPKTLEWPPKGQHLMLHFAAPASAPVQHKAIMVTVHYEMYVGMPILSKWVTVSTNDVSGTETAVAFLAVESLALNSQWVNWIYMVADDPNGPVMIQEEEKGKEAGSFQPTVSFVYRNDIFVPIGKDSSLSLCIFHIMQIFFQNSTPFSFHFQMLWIHSESMRLYMQLLILKGWAWPSGG